MIDLFRRKTAFGRALEALGLDRCSRTGEDLWVGLQPDPGYRRTPVITVPNGLRSILLVEGPDQTFLVDALVRSPEAQTVENLMIGTSHEYIPHHLLPYDFTLAVEALKGAQLPRLNRLILGDMELLFNGHGYYGILGDLTDVFDIAPNLTELRICGQAELARPVRHERLQSLQFTADDVAGNCGPARQSFVTNLLSSDFPCLTRLDLSLEADDVPQYTLPESFFVGSGLRSLASMSIDCLTPDHQVRLDAWKHERNVD